MKKLSISLAIIMVLMSGCANKEDQGTTANVSDSPIPSITSAPTQLVTATPPPTASPTNDLEEEKQMECEDIFGKLYPNRDDGSILAGKEINELAKTLTRNIRSRLTEITYTYKKNKISMEVLAGNRDIYQSAHPLGEDAIQKVYNESEYYNYLLYLPKNYDPKDTDTKWPVIYFFHGIGERGDDLNKVMDYGVPKYVVERGDLDAIVIAPQCPKDSHWADTDVEEPKLAAFIEENNKKYNIDTNRIYATGLSMGGRCTWKQVLAMPDTFAAAVVVCGRTNTYDFSQILDMPIWMFHGAIDDTVAFKNINQIVKELFRQEHQYFKLTVYPFLSHDTWTSTYARSDIYDWLLAHTLDQRNQ